MNIELIIGIAAGTCTGVSLLPQLIKMLQHSKATDVSKATLIVLLAGVSLWVCYGILKKDWPIIITNAFSLLINLLILFFRWHFKRQHKT